MPIGTAHQNKQQTQRRRQMGCLCWTPSLSWTLHRQPGLLRPDQWPHCSRSPQVIQQQQNGAFRRVWYMQDGAPAHRALPVRNRLQELFGNRVGHQIDWPARSPDLSPLDFYLWGTAKQRVYRQSPPASLWQLRNRITDAFNEIRRTMVRRAVRHMTTRVQRCVNLQGGHVDGRWISVSFILQHDMFNKTKRQFSEQTKPKRPFSGPPNNKREKKDIVTCPP